MLKNHSLYRIIPIFVLIIPPLLFLWAEIRFTVDMPVADDYDVLAWLYDFLHSTGFVSHLLQLLSQQNEHRILLDRVIAIAELPTIGVVNFVYLNVFGFFGLVFTTVIILAIAWRNGMRSYEMIPLILLLFSFSQYQLVSWAMASMQAYWYLFFSLSAIFFLTGDERRINFILGSCLAVLAAFTSGGGVLVLPAVLLFFIIIRNVARAVIWACLSAIVFYVYFVALHYTAVQPGIASHQFAQHHPFLFASYVLHFLGSAVPWHAAALVVGLAGLVAGGYLVVRVDCGLDRALAIIAILFFATAAAAGLNRVSVGVVEALQSRYTIYSGLFLSALYIGCLTAARSNILRMTIFAVALTCSLGLYATWFGTGVAEMRARRSVVETSLVYYNRDRAVAILNRSIASKIFSPIVELGPIKPSSPPPTMVISDADPVEDCSLDTINGEVFASLNAPIAVDKREVEVVGWTAPIARRGVGPDETWISLVGAAGERRFYPAKPVPRPDVLALFKQPQMKTPGFSVDLDLSGLGGSQQVTIYSTNDNKAFRCGETAVLELSPESSNNSYPHASGNR